MAGRPEHLFIISTLQNARYTVRMAGKLGMQRKSGAGNIRRRENGKWQATYLTPEGDRVSLGTFDRKGDARNELDAIHQDMVEGRWINPKRNPPGRLPTLPPCG